MRKFVFAVLLLSGELTIAQRQVRPDATCLIPDVIKKVEKRGYFITSLDFFKGLPRVDIREPMDAPVDRLLKDLLRGLNLRAWISDTDRTITFGRLYPSSSSRFTELRCRVVNEKGQPMPDATVMGGRSIVLTDKDGWFHIPVQSFETRVQITVTGYGALSISLSNREVDTIALTPAAKGLDRVIVNAFGVTTQRLNTGSVFNVQGSDIRDVPSGHVLDGLAARVPGFYDRVPNGVPGTAHITTLGGQHSIVSGNRIYWLLDGVPLAADGSFNPIETGTAQGMNGAGSLNFIPADIVGSVSLLKDASATTIYGSRASTGVVLITLKAGKPGSVLHWGANFNMGVGRALHTSRMIGTTQFLQMRTEAVNNDGYTADISRVPELKWDKNRQVDYQHFTTGGTARIANGSLTLSGGSPHVFFLTSASLHRETTVFPGSTSDERRSLYGNLHVQSGHDRLELILSALYTWEGNHLPIDDYTGDQRLAPNAPPFYNAVGQPQWSGQSLSFLNIPALGGNEYFGNFYTLVGHMKLSYQLGKHISIEQNLGYNGILTNERALQPLSGQAPGGQSPLAAGIITQQGNQYTSTIVQTISRWVGQVGPGMLTGLLGVERQGRVTSSSAQMSSYITDAQMYSNLGATKNSGSGNQLYYRYAAAFARVDYDVSNRYLLTASWRRDGSSRFGPGNQYGNFWAVGLGWIFSEESFLHENSILSYGKVRASMGTTGNDQIGDGQYAETYSAASSNRGYSGMQGVVPVTLANTHLQWELNYREEVALELGFFDNKIQFSVAASRNQSANQMIYKSVGPVAGLPGVLSNEPIKVINEALEFVLETNLVSTKQWCWTSAATLTIPRNVLQSWPGLDNSQYASTYVPGHSLSVIKGYHLIGVDPGTGNYVFKTAVAGGAPGLQDMVPIAGTDPRFYAGWSNRLKFGNWELDLLIDWRRQNGFNPLLVLGRDNAPGRQAPSQLSNGPVEWLDHWRNPGDHAKQQRLTTTPGSGTDSAWLNYLQSDAWTIDASFIRCKSFDIFYSLPCKVTKKLGLRTCKVYISAQNLWTHSHFPITDPETQDPKALPPLRTVVGGIKINF